MLINAIILAGDGNLGKLEGHCDVENKALIPIGNRIMLDYVVSALQASAKINKIVIVGPLAELKTHYGEKEDIILANSGKDIIESVTNGLALLESSEYVFLTTSDIPLLQEEAIESFLSKCLEGNYDIYYPIVSKEINEQSYPNVKRTYINLKDGIYTGGNIFLFRPEIVNKCSVKIKKLFSLRKNPIALAKQIGFTFVLKLLCQNLTIAEVEEKASKMLAVKGKALIIEYPEIGIDVDKPSDLDLVRRVLA